MNEIKRAYLILVAITVGLFLWVSVFSVAGWISNRNRATEGQQAHTAICVLVKDLNQRAKRDSDDLSASRDFLKNNPNGIPGISKVVIEASISVKARALVNEKRTIASLKVAKCS